MFILTRALAYAALFIWLWFVLVPGWLGLGASGPEGTGPLQYAGILVGGTGLGLVLWCVWNFALKGKGTPALFDPPRALVATGPYRHVRNPMYIGGATLMLGSAIYFQSWVLAAYAAAFFALTAALVLLYEEPHLRRVFGESYAEYCRRTPRWIPALRAR